MVLYNFKNIQVVPKGDEFIDIVLTRTQRRTPTQVHPGFAISRIRKFYMRKVKYTAETINEKLTQIINDFPVVDDIHPFYADLINVLYDKDHYKLALGQMSIARRLVETIAKDYVKLLKFGDSLYRCKQLKRAALGRMVKVLKKNALSFNYLEDVRQHLARLPSIDPNTRTILICGYPNVGKSSFMNKLTRADVDVQPYAFTTKSLFVGHMDYKFLRWQMIDTPGILDHALDERNTIEMQSITALAHLRSTILYFIDISEQCGYTIAQQCSLCESIKPLFANKPVVIVMNKIDLIKPTEIPQEDRNRIDALTKGGNVVLLPMSTVSEEGIMEVKRVACDALLEHRTNRLTSKKADSIKNRIHVAQPQRRDNLERPPVKPEALVNEMKNNDEVNESSVAFQREQEWLKQQMLFDEYNPEWKGVDRRDRYLLEDPEWRYDNIPEMMDGHNIMDFLSDDIIERYEELEREEAALLRSIELEQQSEQPREELSNHHIKLLAQIREKKDELLTATRLRGKNSFESIKLHKKRTLKALEDHFTKIGLDGKEIAERVSLKTKMIPDRSRSRARSLSTDKRSQSLGRARSETLSRGRKRSRKELESRGISASRVMGMSEDRKNLADKIARRSRKSMARYALKGESDRVILNPKPKHLYAGKMGFKRDRR